MKPLELALLFHETYVNLCPVFGFKLCETERQFAPRSKQGMLMIAVSAVILEKLKAIEKATTNADQTAA